MGISGAVMDEHYCPNTVKQALECTFSVPPTIMDHDKDIHLDIDLLFVNKILTLLMISYSSCVEQLIQRQFLALAAE